MFLLAGSLWGLPCGPAVAAGPATSAGQDVSPTSVAAAIPDTPAMPSDVAVPEPWNLHGQFTFVKQYHPSFASPYQGTNSLSPGRSFCHAVTLICPVSINVPNAVRTRNRMCESSPGCKLPIA